LKKLTFEESLKRLEEITEKLESGELSLDDSLKYFEEGVKLSRFCEKKLTETEQKVKILESTDINDTTIDLDENDNTDEKLQTKNKKKKKFENNNNETENLNGENFLF